MNEIRYRCEAYAKLNPSEDPKAVETAIRLLAYPEVESETKFTNDEIRIIFTGSAALKKMRDQAAARRVRAVLRRLLISNYSAGKITIMLNRQALTRGIISFVESESESPLGPVYLEIYTGELQAIASYLTSEKSFQRWSGISNWSKSFATTQFGWYLFASFKSLFTSLTLWLIWVSTSNPAFASDASFAASDAVECPNLLASSEYSSLYVLSNRRISTPSKNLRNLFVALVSPE